MKPRLLEPRRSNGPSYLSHSRFKPLGFLEKKPSLRFSPVPLEACVQLERCPSYPSKSKEEGKRSELLEWKRRRVPQASTGVTKGASLSFFSSSSPFSLFCRLSRWQIAHLQSSRRHWLPPRLILQSTFQETSRLELLLHYCCPPAATLFS